MSSVVAKAVLCDEDFNFWKIYVNAILTVDGQGFRGLPTID